MPSFRMRASQTQSVSRLGMSDPNPARLLLTFAVG